MQFRISAYLTLRKGEYRLSPVCGSIFDWSVYSRDASKVRTHALDRLRKELPHLPREVLPRVEAVQGRRLERVRLDFNLQADDGPRAATGLFPLVIEQRLARSDELITLAYHPYHPAEWFEVDGDKPLAEQAERLFADLFEYDDELASLKAEQQDKLVTLSFNAEPPSLLSLIKSDGDSQPKLSGFGTSGELSALLRVATNETAHAADRRLDAGMPRAGLRERLASLLCGDSKRSVLVVGPPGSGKSTLIAQAVYDLLEADDYLSHRNLDRVHNVWRMQGRHIIAGMSYVGQWEARCVELLCRARSEADGLVGRGSAHLAALGAHGAERALPGRLLPRATRSPERADDRRGDGRAARGAGARRAGLRGVVRARVRGAEQHQRDARHDAARGAQARGRSRHRLRPALLRQDLRFERVAALVERVPRQGARAAESARPQDRLRDDGIPRDGHDQRRDRALFPANGLPELLLSIDQPLERAGAPEGAVAANHGATGRCRGGVRLDLVDSRRSHARGRPYGVFLFSGPTAPARRSSPNVSPSACTAIRRACFASTWES